MATERTLVEFQKSHVREYFESIVIAVILALFIRTFIVQAFKIPSGSMLPTLQIGDHILVNKLAYGLRVPVPNLAARDIDGKQLVALSYLGNKFPAYG